MQITNSLTIFARSNALNARAAERRAQNEENATVQASSATANNTESETATSSIRRARNFIVEQTIQGEVVRPEADDAQLPEFDPFARVAQRVFDSESRRDNSQTALNAYSSIQAQSERDALVETLGIDVFA